VNSSPSHPLAEIVANYQAWLLRQPFATTTQRAYAIQVRRFCHFLADQNSELGDPLHDPESRILAVREYKTFLKIAHKAKPTTVNLALSAVDSFYRFLGGKRPQVKRETLPRQAPRALTPGEQQRFQQALQNAQVRDQAISLLLYYTGLRISECAALNVDDILLSAGLSTVIVRNGKGGKYREVPLNTPAQQVLVNWVEERIGWRRDDGQMALFLNKSGGRLSVRSINDILRRLSARVGLVMSAHTLRHTCLTNLVRRGHDLVLVAEIAGHSRLETTQRYSLPSARDKVRAMESLWK